MILRRLGAFISKPAHGAQPLAQSMRKRKISMFKTFLLAFLFAFIGAASANAQVSKSELLSRIDKDKVTFQRAPLYMVPAQLTQKLLERTKARYPKFKESMWYYHYVIDNGYYNMVFFDWTGDECLYLQFKKDALEKKDKEIVNFVNDPSKGSSVAKKETIPVKYCEKLYNFYSDK